ncbi:MAG: polysaccharide deacetylase family protein [Myxococcaceae bacterium]|nr:polysaccharide deacetylase family protein [Myxococcaceae bacterium]
MPVLVWVVVAATQAPVAWTDRAQWPRGVGVADFDTASRAELFAYAEALDALPDEVGEALGVRQGDVKALRRWKAGREAVVVRNLRDAMKHCTAVAAFCPPLAPQTLHEAAVQGTTLLDRVAPAFHGWRDEARRFHATYVREVARLALLSSRISSEVAPVADGEDFGEAMPDKTFLLTFDDGPTGVGGETDKLLGVLAGLQQHAIFFTVGDAVHARGSIARLYDDHCLASHGLKHESHVVSKRAAERLDGWHDELRRLEPSPTSLRWWRPPYGQRTKAQVEGLADEGVTTMLWNIDSQDWQAPVERALVTGRVVTLMLLWRRGVVLFHDTLPVAREVVPRVVGAVGAAVTFSDCRTMR